MKLFIYFLSVLLIFSSLCKGMEERNPEQRITNLNKKMIHFLKNNRVEQNPLNRVVMENSLITSAPTLYRIQYQLSHDVQWLSILDSLKQFMIRQLGGQVIQNQENDDENLIAPRVKNGRINDKAYQQVLKDINPKNKNVKFAENLSDILITNKPASSKILLKETKDAFTTKEVQFLNAVQKGDANLIRITAENFKDVPVDKLINQNGLVPLEIAVIAGNIAAIQYLTEELDADTYAHNMHAHDLLNKLPKRRTTELLNFLHKRALLDASKHGDLKFLQHMIQAFEQTSENACDINTLKDKKTGKTALHIAAEFGHVKLITYLVKELGANIYSEDNNGNIPYSLAMQKKHIAATELIARIMQVFSKDKVLLDAVSQKDITLINRILEERKKLCSDMGIGILNINSIRDINGNTALHRALQQKYFDIAEILIKNCKPQNNSVNNNGITLLHLATENNQERIVKYLVEQCNADPSKRDRTGKSAINIAFDMQNYQLGCYLMENAKKIICLKNDSECPICLELPSTKGYQNCTLTPCCNKFICKSDFVENCNRTNKCPLCRKSTTARIANIAVNSI